MIILLYFRPLYALRDFSPSALQIFSLSGYLVNANNPAVSVEFAPDKTKEELIEIIKTKQALPYILKEELLTGIVNKRIGQNVLKRESTSAEKIANLLKNFTIKITGSLGFNYAQVTKGGIETKDIDSTTYQSKLSKGLYIIGEALDVDGDCGGYNLTFAIISAIQCAKSIKK